MRTRAECPDRNGRPSRRCAAELVAEIGPVPGFPQHRRPGRGRSAARGGQAIDSTSVRSTRLRRQTTRALDLDRAMRRSPGSCCCCGRRRRPNGGRPTLHVADADDALEAAVAAAIGVRTRRGPPAARDAAPARRRSRGPRVGNSAPASTIFREFGDDVRAGGVAARAWARRGVRRVARAMRSGCSAKPSRCPSGSATVRGRAWVRQHQAWVAFLSGDTALAETRLMLTAAQEFDLLGDRFRPRVGRRFARVSCASSSGRFDEAEALGRRGPRDSVELGDPMGSGDDGLCSRGDSAVVVAVRRGRGVVALGRSRVPQHRRPVRRRAGTRSAHAVAGSARSYSDEAERGIEESLALE